MRNLYFIMLALLLSASLAACSSDSANDLESIAARINSEIAETADEQETTVAETIERDADEETADTTKGTLSANGLPMIDPLAFDGEIALAGSSTVFPLAERMAERFNDEGFGGSITIDSIGSGGGFERFCESGESDITNSSRPIKESEVDECRVIGREPIEFRVGTDALAIVVSKENQFAANATMDELVALFSTAETWSDVNPAWPDEAILRYIPGTDSGTFDYFVEAVFHEEQKPILEANNLELSEDDNVLVQGILGSPYAVGFFGYAYYQENADTLNIFSIDGVEAVKENVDNNSYPLARPLYMYSTAEIMQEKPQVAAFLNFMVTYVNEEVVDVGYFPASEADLQLAIDGVKTGLGMMTADTTRGALSANGLPMIDPLAFDGEIALAGSSTVFPLAERMAERFNDEGFGGSITIDSIGSGGGFERFCESGESDITNSSRPIKESEVDECRVIGREPIEFRVGTDALAIVVSKENQFAANATMDELVALFSTAETWSDVNPAWPDEAILRYIPGTDSGTFDYFVEAVFHEEQKPILEANNLELSEDDNVLVQGILGSPYAVGFFGYAYYQENADTLNIFSIDGVEAVKENVDNNSYPLARPLYMYSTAEIMQEKPQVAAFLNFMVTYVNEEVVDVGYFPASEADLQLAIDGVKTGLGMMAADAMAEEAAAPMIPEIDPLMFDGEISMAGSSTVFPLAERMAERFNDEGFGGSITIDSIGSGGGFERFCESGESDITNSSRPIKESEVDECRVIGREPIEFRVGTDALAIVVSKENQFAANATMDELVALFSTAETWSDVNPAWPDEAILRYIPGTDSGTFDYFVEAVFHEEQKPILEANNLELSEDDNVLVQGILGSPYAVGFFGYAYYQENADTLNIFSIDGVEAVKENVDNNSYPLARPLYVYTTAEIMQEKPQVAAFLGFVLSFVNEEVIDVGYFPAAETDLRDGIDAWLAANPQ